MGILHNLRRLVPWVDRTKIQLNVQDCRQLAVQWSIKDLAIETAVNLISNALTQAEFRTYERGKAIEGENWYRWNVQPNQNENATRFLKRVVSKLVRENGALVILNANTGEYHLADSYRIEERVYKPNLYHDIAIGDLHLNRQYKETEVLHFSLHNARMRDLVDGMYADYQRLLAVSQDTYRRSNTRRGVLEIPTNYPQTPEAREKLEKLVAEQMREFLGSERPYVLPLSNGLKYTDLTNPTYKNGSDSRDIRQLINDIFDYVALALCIPPQLLRGEVASIDAMVEHFVNFCVRPIKELIEDEINRKIYTPEDLRARTYMVVDTSLIAAGSIKTLAPVIETLTRTGANTLDDTLQLLGREPLREAWSHQRWRTLDLHPYDADPKREEER